MKQQNDETKQDRVAAVETVRVRPVAGRLYRNGITREALLEEAELERTRAVERAIAAGDLEEVGGSVKRGEGESAERLEKERY